MTSQYSWLKITNPDEVNSPSLLIYYTRLESNIKRMISVAGNPDYLRPHLKTHKMPEVVRLLIKHGIMKFKCATISEAEMAAQCGAEDVLLAYQPVGPNIDRFFKLKMEYMNTNFSCLADCESIINSISRVAVKTGISTSVWLDINNGMDRTGVEPGDIAVKLYKLIKDSQMLVPGGIHVYDGHIHDNDLFEREKTCKNAFLPVLSLLDFITDTSANPVKVIAGGTPTFPLHAKRKGIELSPGTTVLWDYGYSSSFADMDFLHAAVLFTRVISKPGHRLICFDLGTKAVASEMPHPRIKIIGIDDYEFVSHNEEHMVIRTPEADKIKVGDPFYCIPYHICPTVDRYDKVYVVRDGCVTEEWNVVARRREITV